MVRARINGVLQTEVNNEKVFYLVAKTKDGVFIVTPELAVISGDKIKIYKRMLKLLNRRTIEFKPFRHGVEYIWYYEVNGRKKIANKFKSIEEFEKFIDIPSKLLTIRQFKKILKDYID